MNSAIRFTFIMLMGSLLISGCAMISAWRSIPPPGGCDRCHTARISNNWALNYTPVNLTDEQNRPWFQSPEQVMPPPPKPDSSLEVRKYEDSRCFDCHRSPNAAHRERSGSYHHH